MRALGCYTAPQAHSSSGTHPTSSLHHSAHPSLQRLHARLQLHPSFIRRASGRGAPAWLRVAVVQLPRLRGSGGQVDAAACWRGWGGHQRWKRARASCSQQKLRCIASSSISNRFQWLPKTQTLTTLTLMTKMRRTCAVQATFVSCAGKNLLAFKSARTSSTSRR